MKRSMVIMCAAALLAATSASAQKPAAQPGPGNNAVNKSGQDETAKRENV